ncbi:MAG: family 10 glycosylhydrolase [Candidatus Aegiribacteria sp.]|nr:family 10 glycosylhydrolase [Candidatus Aegiribacteria sp.]
MRISTILLSVLVFIAIQGAYAGNQVCDRRYFWVVRDGLQSPESIDELIDRAADAGANGIIVQVAGRAEAYYSSSILPRAAFQDGFDPLAYTIARARPRGMEVHAWINAFLVWSATVPPNDSTHIWYTHPEWFMTDRNGQSTRDYTRDECDRNGLVGATLSPAFPEVRAFVAKVAAEIAMNYNVDGIHLDYIRYPNPSFGFEPLSAGMFFLETGLDPLEMFRRYGENEELTDMWSLWKINNVTRTVETVRSVLRSEAPGVLLSCAVMADPNEAESHYSCDWRSWLDAGLVDFVCTMAYTTNTQKARELAIQGAAVCPERVIHGIGIYNQPMSSATAGASEALAQGIRGVCVFSLNSLSSDNAWVMRNFWGEQGSTDFPIDSAVFQRVTTRSVSDNVH